MNAIAQDELEFPVSFAQQRLWFLEQLEGTGAAYTVRLAVRLRGPLDPACLQQALDALVERHEALRTTIRARGGEPVQVIALQLRVPVELIAMEGSGEEELRRRVGELSGFVFDLARGPLLRVVLLRAAAADHVLLILTHHIVSDAWSSGILFRDLAALYGARAGDAVSALPGMPLQYADFAIWQREWLQGAELARQTSFWQAALAGAPPLSTLPGDRARPALQSYRGSRWTHILPRGLVTALHGLARAEGSTLYMVLFAAFYALLARHSGQTDLVVGTPVAGRRRTELEQVIGFFANTLAMRCDLSGDPPFRDLLARVRQGVLRAWDHQDLPFEKLVEALQPPRSLSHAPLFQVMFILQNTPWEAAPIAGLEVTPADTDATTTAKFDLTLSATEYDGELWLAFEYNTDLYLQDTMARLAGHYEALLRGALDAPATRLGDLPLQSEQELRRLLHEWNATDAPLEGTLGVSQRLRRSVAEQAGTTAIECGSRHWTYRELDAWAAMLADRLRDLGAAPGEVVALCVERSPEMVGAVLAALDSGAAYLPLDPEFPEARLRFMLEDSGARLLVTQRSLALRFAAFPGPVLCIDALAEQRAVEDGVGSKTPRDCAAGRAPPAPIGADDIAYLMYTSGSSGRPKGVRVTHGGVVNFLQSMLQQPGLQASDRLLAVTTLSFDIAVLELLGPLLVGGTVVLASAAAARDGEELARLIDTARISVMQATPATWRALLAAGWSSRPQLRMLCGGEALDAELATRLLAGGGRLWNMYGPTETTVWSSCGEITDPQRITVGRPIANTRFYVLDARGQPVPVGVGGELWIGGAGVAAGYHGLDELTAERFVATGWPGGGRRYRTGDRARWRADGVVEFLGRMDGQLKLRGFRVEPGEVEAALGSIPGVAGCAVGVRETGPGDERLVAWVVAATGAQVEPARLRSALAEQLPGYMVPGEFVVVAQLPLTANGKLDRARLPAPRWGEGSGEVSGRVAPRNALEEALAGLFGEVLGRGVGIHDDFFALGGHSLLATRLIARIRDALEVEVALRELFERPTVAGLAGALGGARLRGSAVERRGGHDEELPLSYPQQRLWFLERLQPGGAAYHLHAAYRLRGELRVEALQRALAAVLARHEALRTVFVERAGEPRQRVLAQLAVAVGVESALGWSEAALGQRLLEWVQQPFDLERGPLLRVQVFECGGAERVLLVVMHHIISDGWSLSVLLRELSAGYAAALAGREPGWAALPVQYGDYAEWQRRELSGARLGEELAWWRAALAGAPTRLDLPTDRPRLPVQRHRGARCFHTLAAADTDRLRALARDAGCTLYMVLLAAFEVVLARYSGAEDFLVGTPVAGRSRTELEGLVGFFVGTLVLRARVAGDPAFGELLGRVKRTALDAYAHAELPFERLVEELQPPRDPGRTPLFQVMFNFHSEPAQLLELYGLEATRIAVTRESSKFDLTASLVEHDGGLHLTFEYDTDLFDGLTVEGMLSGFAGVLRAVGERSQLRVSEVVLSSGVVTERLRRVPAAVPAADARGTLAERLAAQAAATPERTAVVWADGSWSYGELWPQVQAVAARIVAAAGAGAGRIGLLLGHDGAMVTGLLGTLAAGKSYVPLDAYAPGARNEGLIAGAGVQAVVTDAQRLGQAPWLGESALAVVVLDGEDLRVPVRDVAAAAAPVDAGSEAYVLYTSGTTGEPQGVVQSQGNVLGQVGLWVRSLGLTAADRLSLFSGYGYDAAVQDLFGALLTGASVHLYDLRGAQSAPELIDRIAAERVSVLHLTPTVYRHLFGGRVTCTQDLSAVRLVVLGGEPARRSDLELFKVRFRRGARLVNGLGLTESTMGLQFVADHDTRVLGEGLPVGRAVAGVEARLLDAQGREGGWRGELALVGEYITPGYLGDAGRTARRLRRLADGRVLLRTGDLVRRLPDGELLHVGRVDRQVQIRGMRVEPAELEAALGELLPGSECAVVARADPAGEPMLVAYLAGTECGDEAALRAGLRARLPEYLLPSALVWLAALPRRANGKLDEGALPAPQAPAAGAALPRDERERRLAQLWGELLGRERIGVHDDFFALGGHSLLATRLIARLRDAFAVELPLIALFEHPTVAGLAAAIERTAARPAAPGLPAPRRRPRNAAGGG
ncbi:MAG: amino acid adenylation domain-containing protein [Gammaproteobacteria bacterium]|nr:MAG: amino acid adenylation domain-containing protein [Gammaproteobacteria bacterium]